MDTIIVNFTIKSLDGDARSTYVTSHLLALDIVECQQRPNPKGTPD